MARRISVVVVAVTLMAIGLPSPNPSHAAQQPGGGVGTVGAAGIVVDADGVLRMEMFRDPSPQLARQRVAAAIRQLNPQLAQPSKLRKVSITRLEAEIARCISTQRDVTDEMKYLAGLTRIQFVFFYPETRDIVIAGPAEGFVQDPSGRALGVVSGRATLELQDLIVALRAFPPDASGVQTIGVSIDPTQEGLQRMQQFLRRIAGQVRPADDRRIAAGLRQNLGLQTVTINGVSPRTHFAQVMVEADYRMKLIGIGLERPTVRIESYVSRANPADVARNALQRWYFTPNYECVRVSEDGLAMQLVGDGVQLIGEDEMVTAGGGRVATRQSNAASDMFVREFTKMYPLLAMRSPVYAQLRNLIDLSIAAAFIKHQDYYNQAEWRLGVFADEQRLPVETYNTPKQVSSAVNVVWKGATLITPIGGGVNIRPQVALVSDRLLADEDSRVQRLRQAIAKEEIPPGTWWWD